MRRALFLGLLAGTFATTDAQGLQGTKAPQVAAKVVAIVPSKSCAKCQLTMRKVATFTDSLFDLDFKWQLIARDGSGSFLALGRNGGTIGVFSSSGVFQRSIGRMGSGLGEIRQPMSIAVGRGESLYVSDLVLQRMTDIDPAATKTVRDFAIPARRRVDPAQWSALDVRVYWQSLKRGRTAAFVG